MRVQHSTLRTRLTEKQRGWLYQFLFIAVIIGTGWLLISTLLENLQRQGIVTGFGFLDDTSGFGVIFSLIEYSESDTYGRVFWVGLGNTLLVAGLGIMFSTVLGFIIGIARLSHNFLARNIASAYIGLFRNVPLLLHLFFWYFAVLRPLPSPKQSIQLFDAVFLNNRGLYLPKLLPNDGTSVWEQYLLIVLLILIVIFLARRFSNRSFFPTHTTHQSKKHFSETISRVKKYLPQAVISLLVISCLSIWAHAGSPYDLEIPTLTRFNFSGGMVIIPELVALLLALSLYTAAYIAEIVRAGIESVPKGQTEAAQSLGLKQPQILRLVIIPQALRLIIPPLTNQYLNLTKNSSLAAAIAYPDLVSIFTGTVLNQTGQAVEIIAITMSVYLSISLSISLLMSLYERSNQWSHH